jgi:hypothetical protein
MWYFNSVVQFLSSRLGCSISGFQLGALSRSGLIYYRMMMIRGSEPETINCMLQPAGHGRTPRPRDAAIGSGQPAGPD